MTYHQGSPYQTTVIEQPLVVVPLVSGPTAYITRHAPAHIRNGTKVLGHNVSLTCICCVSVFGVVMFVMGALTLLFTNWNTEYYKKNGNFSYPPNAIFGIIQLFLGAPFIFISAYLCGISKRDFDRQQSHVHNGCYAEPLVEGRDTSGHINSSQRQSAFSQTITAIAPPVYNYEPVANPPTPPPSYNPSLIGIPPLLQQPHENTDSGEMTQATEDIPNTSSSGPDSCQTGTEQLTSQPLIDTFAAVVPDPQAPYTGLELALAQVFEEHPANDPPEYFP